MGSPKISLLFLRKEFKFFPGVVMEEGLVDDEYRIGSSSDPLVEGEIIL